jgi:DNA invertase Pin-like site-specific DNA recombinase
MTKKPAAFVAYHRVSTIRQGESGLGLEAQRAAVEAFARQHGGAIVASFVEVETGKRSDRPELPKALEAARGRGRRRSSLPSSTGWPAMSPSSQT